jgi:tetratricopeptide (TPR) repeat protein
MEYERAIEADPDLPEARYGLAILLRREGKRAQADSQFAIFQRLQKGGEDAPEVRRRRKMLQERVFQHPDDPVARFDLGDLLTKAGDLEGARRAFEEVLALQPDHVRAMNKLGRIHMHQKRPIRALKMHQRAIQVAPDYVPSYLYAGDACMALGRLKEAMAYYRSSMQSAPENPLPWYHLGVALIQMKRWTEADSVLSRGRSLAEGNRRMQGMFDRAFRALPER